MEELQEFSEKEESNFDLKAEIYRYLAYWKWLLFCSFLGLSIAYLYNRYTLPQYRTEATMMVLNEEPNSIALPSGGAASILTIDGASLANQIETLTSKQMVENVIDELDLNIFYYIEGNVIDVEAYKESPVKINFFTPDSIVHNRTLHFKVNPVSETSYELIIEEKEFIKKFEFGEAVKLNGLKFFIIPRGGEFEIDQIVEVAVRPMRWVAMDFISRLEITPKGKAKDILSLSLIGKVPEKSQDFLNTLMRLFNLDGMEDKRQVAENTTEFIQERLQIISQELDSVEGGIADFKRENQLMDVAGSASQFLAKSSMAEQKIFEIETQLEVMQYIEEALTSADSYSLLPTNMGIAEGGISGEIGNYNTLVLERNAYLNSATIENPVVKVLTEQLNAIKENLLENITSAKQSLRIQLQELNALDRSAEGEFSNFPGLEKGIRSIERQQQIKEQLYLFLLQRREEAAISFAATSPVAKVIDPAYTLNEPVDPKPWLILVGGFFIGLLLPLLVIFTKNFLDTKVHSKGDLQPLIRDIPFLGEVPKVKPEDSEVIQLNDRSPLAESFRILRTNLAYLVQPKNKEKGEIIFVTSTIKGEGKTFVSFNMGRTLASTGKKVLVIGADIRNPKLHKYSKEPIDTVGLSDYLYNYDVSLRDVVHPSEEGNILTDMVYSGAIPPNPAELFMSERMKELLKEAKNIYDFIIVDTAPTMIVTDTLLISPLADTTLYVIKSGYTDKKLLDFPKELKQQGKLKGLAIILNDVDYSKFSYGAKYGYSYGYGYGYGADDEKKGFLSNLFKKKKK